MPYVFLAYSVSWQMLLPYFRQILLPYFRQMLLPYFMWYMLQPPGRCYSLILYKLEDVIAIILVL